MIDTYYERLGVAPDATDEELRTAYRHRARQLHPDARHELTAGPMAELNEAWRVLRDPERRRTYDAGLPGANGGAAAERGGVRVWDDQLEVSPPVAARGGRGLLVAVMLGILAAIFVFTAFARTPETRPAAPRVDGYLSVGDCVAARPGMVVEVPCGGSNVGVVQSVVGSTSACPESTQAFHSPDGALRVCVALRSDATPSP